MGLAFIQCGVLAHLNSAKGLMVMHNCTPNCTAGWSPSNKCHCRDCGENFTTVANFDRHRVGGVCTHPLLLKKSMEPNLRGYWREVGEIDRAEIFRRSVANPSTRNGHSDA